jgi:16S rRNA processing protein RimM
MLGAYLAVARLHKPHGLKGEAVVWALTDEPEEVLAEGRRVVPLDEAGAPAGEALTITRSRRYHREWLVKFAEVEDRTTLEGWRGQVFGVPATDLRSPDENELYEHEIPGAAVVAGGRQVGEAVELLQGAGGPFLMVRVGEREVLVPFRAPIVCGIDRATRTIELDPPAGLLEL